MVLEYFLKVLPKDKKTIEIAGEMLRDPYNAAPAMAALHEKGEAKKYRAVIEAAAKNPNMDEPTRKLAAAILKWPGK
jgi:hypothetical protein